MTLTRFGRLCLSLPGAAMAVQWGGSHVFKIGAKMFALGNQAGGDTAFVFKAAPLTFQILLEQRLAERAPYLPRGNWVMVAASGKLPDADLAAYLYQSYRMVAGSLPKAARRELSLTEPA